MKILGILVVFAGLVSQAKGLQSPSQITHKTASKFYEVGECLHAYTIYSGSTVRFGEDVYKLTYKVCKENAKFVAELVPGQSENDLTVKVVPGSEYRDGVSEAYEDTFSHGLGIHNVQNCESRRKEIQAKIWKKTLCN